MLVSKIWLYFPKDETRGSARLDLILTSEEELVEELNIPYWDSIYHQIRNWIITLNVHFGL